MRARWDRAGTVTAETMQCFFTSDLHGRVDRYDRLFAAIVAETPRAVFLGGDLLPTGSMLGIAIDPAHVDFVNGYLVPRLDVVRHELGTRYPDIFLILGNDDARIEEAAFLDAASRGAWHYIHERRLSLDRYAVYGYACVPPTPFSLKDWELYDVSRYVDPGCVPPDEGWRTVPADLERIRWTTIEKELRKLTDGDDLEEAIFLFHSPPYDTPLDRAGLDGVVVDHVPVDPHVGSIAIRRFLEERGPLLSLHGHVHEAPRLTGEWRTRVGRTHAFAGAHDGPQLPLVRFDPADLEAATRDLL